MFDIGFIELLLCAVIALLVLGPERLPVAARAAGRWIGKARRMTRNFTSELDRQLKAEELQEKIRKEGSKLGVDDIQRNFQEGLDQAKKYTDYVIKEDQVAPGSGPAAPSNTAPGENPTKPVPEVGQSPQGPPMDDATERGIPESGTAPAEKTQENQSR